MSLTMFETSSSTEPYPDLFRMATAKIKTTMTSWQPLSRNLIAYQLQNVLTVICNCLKIAYLLAAKQKFRINTTAVIHGARKTSIVMFFSLPSAEDFPTSRGLQVPSQSGPCHNVANVDQCSPGREDQVWYTNTQMFSVKLPRSNSSGFLVVSSNTRRRMLNVERFHAMKQQSLSNAVVNTPFDASFNK